MGPREEAAAAAQLRVDARARHALSRVSKTFEHANWLQALEGGLDTAHSSFAHNETTRRHELDPQPRRCAAARRRADRLRLHVRLDAEPRRRRHVRPRLPLRHAGAADARRRSTSWSGIGEGRRAAPRRPHLGADRRRAHLGLQHDLELRRKRPDHARMVREETKRAGAAAPTISFPARSSSRRTSPTIT